MEYRLVTTMSSFLFLIVDLVILFNSSRHRDASDNQKAFRAFTISTISAQAFSTLCEAAHPIVWRAPVALHYAFYIGALSCMSLCSMYWYLYLRALITENGRLSVARRVLILIPTAILAIACLASPFTHRVFYIDAESVYHRGPLVFLQMASPYTYTVTAIVLAVITGRKGDKARTSKMLRYFFVFLVPSIFCAIIQMYVVSGGFTPIGISIGMILMYLELYVEEANENKRLKAVDAINRKLIEANSEQEAQLEEITSLNTQLEENQSRLEESAAEQEAQLEEIRELNRDLRLNRDRLSHDLKIIGSLSQFFSALFYIDLSTFKYIEIDRSEIRTVLEIAGSAGDSRATFNAIREKTICDEYQLPFAEFTDVSTLPERLRDRRSVSLQFIGKTQGWLEGTFIAADRAEDGRCTYALWAVRTINEQKEKDLRIQRELEIAKEGAEAANNAKTSFLFNMSHDIRTPMNAIMGFRDLLEKHQEEPEKRADYLKKIEESSNVLLSIINNVLEMARIEKGTIEIDESAWSAEQFNDTLYSIFHEMMTQKDIKFTRQIDVLHPYVYCDPIKLREVFINILSNAYKYTNAGGSVNMHLEEIPSDREGYALYRTTITDTGIGMSEEFLPHIFEEFSRESNTTQNKIEGTGLGMPIVKRLLEFMGGTIEVSSRKGEGSTFIVTIPHRIAERSKLVEHAGVVIDPKLFEGKRILLAEDNDLNAEIAVEILGEAGFLIDRAEDGVICCEKVLDSEAGYYDLILMDIQMPNMNGYEATRSIRHMQDSAKANLPILAMTANAFEEDKREALRSGMNGHLAKPINVTELMKSLAGILS